MHTAMASQVLDFQSSSVQNTTGGETKKTVDQQPLFRLLLTYRTEVGQALDCDGSTRVHIIAHDLARDQWQERFAGGTGWIYGIPSGTDDDGSLKFFMHGAGQLLRDEGKIAAARRIHASQLRYPIA